MFNHILIPTDGSSDAKKGAKQGIELAAQLGATVHGLFVVKEGGNPWESTSMDDQHDRAEAYGKEVVAEIGSLAEAAGVEFVNAVEFSPRVYEAINEYAEDMEIDLIVMGSGYHGEVGGIFGSVADKVLRTAHVPVMVLRRELIERDDEATTAAAAR